MARSRERVVEAFGAGGETADAVMRWATDIGAIAKHRIVHAQNKRWLEFEGSVRELELLLHFVH